MRKKARALRQVGCEKGWVLERSQQRRAWGGKGEKTNGKRKAPERERVATVGGCRKTATGFSFIKVSRSFERLKESLEPFSGHPTFPSLIKVLCSPFYS